MALLLSLVVTVILSLLPISSHATVDWNDGFEYGDAKAMSIPWGGGTGTCSNIQPSTTQHHSGAKSVTLTYDGIHDGPGQCWMDRHLNAPSTTLYTRYWFFMENFTVDHVSTKSFLSGTECCYPSFWVAMLSGNPTPIINIQGIILDNGTLDTVNVYATERIPQNQWVCMETRYTMSSPGVDNGIVQMWINGTQVIDKTNQRMRAATMNQKNSPTATFDFIRLYRQNGNGALYYDDFAVSRDTRIGCNGTPPPGDTTAPQPPSGLVVR